MRSALLFVLFTIITQRPLSRADDSFKPTPIPITYWQFEPEDARDGKAIGDETEAQPVAKAPAHYWEDALRHSVYLTLVRDKIDQLIAKGDVISSNADPEKNLAREDNDHDLWEKIKKAPFERIEAEEPEAFGDVTIMSKGRLVEQNGVFKFTEDERNKEKCDNYTCTDGVRAFWSVKRIRQKDPEPGRYHYELTFSILTKEIPKKVKKPYENPTRTFTVRESSPATIVDKPLEHQKQEPIMQAKSPGPERAIWFHKNIHPIPTPRYQGRQYQKTGLDRFFSSLFSDDDYEVIRLKSKPPQHQQTYVPQTYTQYSKISYVGSPTEQHQQKRLMPNQYKTYSVKYSRPPLSQPPVPHPHHYLDNDAIGVVSAPYNVPNHADHKYVQPPGKALRPGWLAIPMSTYPPSKSNSTIETSTAVVAEETSSTVSDVSSTKAPEIVTAYTPPENNNGWPSSPHEDERPPPLTQSYQTFEKPIYGKTKPNTQVKVNYFPEHVRPPVYNAPPGVFVTMDKKPFKPMPPLRLVQTKTIKTRKPTDFRPSPQILDTLHLAEPDPLKDSFRPITVNYENSSIEAEPATESDSEKQGATVTENSKRVEPVRKHHRKPLKKHHKHAQIPAYVSTGAPEIITAKKSSEEENDTIEWANLLGAFSKTTPMAAERERPKEIDTTTTPAPTTTTTVKPTTTITTTKAPETTTTTKAPPKRTRPPPKFTKPPKVNKHKRVTSTTTKAPEREKFTPKKPAHDLTPQASSAAATKTSTKWTPPSSSTTSTTSTTSTSTRPPTTTTIKTTTTSTEATTAVRLTTRPKSINRFRQSTLMQKGTSVNHDKWSSVIPAVDSKTRTIIPPTGHFPRRKGSNFQGYYTSTTASAYDEEEEDYEELPSSSITPKLSVTTEAIIQSTKVEQQHATRVTKTTQQPYEETADQYESVSEKQEVQEDEDSNEEDNDEDERAEDKDDQENYEQDTKYNTEFMFYSRSTTSPSDRTNEIADNEEPLVTEQTVIASNHSVPKNKTKCKKKLTTTTTEEPEEFDDEEEEETIVPTTTASTIVEKTTPDIFDELFGGFTFDEPKEVSTRENNSTTDKPEREPDEEESENHEIYSKLEDKDFEDFLSEFEDKDEDSNIDDSFYSEEKNVQESNYEDEDVDGDDDEKESKRGSDDDVLEHSPFSLLELMAME